jgi:lipoprotein signal peptidase
MTKQPTRGWLICFFTIAILGAAADILTKDFISGRLNDDERAQAQIIRTDIIPGFFSLLTNSPLNKGALFSLGNDFKEMSNYVLIGISSIAILGIIGWAIWPHAHRSFIYLLTLSLILGGAFGNCYDRLMFGGVRDWIWVYWQRGPNDYPFNWPVFNLADCYLVGGAILLVVHGIFFAPKPVTPAVQAVPAAQ